ncbi:MAG: cell division protein FtsQ/DivIB [Pseudomonadales bacterium]|nr:cell division protein FtsQ/DivIB [Pseudomonadales bacterium]
MNVTLKKIGIYLLPLMAFFAMTKWLVGTLMVDQWPIARVSVEGLLNSGEKQQIREVVADHIREGFVLVRLDEVVASVMALSWPGGVEVHRVWPDKLRLHVTRQSLVARWNGSGYLSASGQVVLDPDLPNANLPRFFVQHASAISAMRVFEGLNDVIQHTHLKIVELYEDAQGSWRVQFGGGLEVALGTDELNGRLARFVRVYNKSLQYNLEQIARVDARYQNGVAVKWTDASLSGDGLALAVNDLVIGERR